MLLRKLLLLIALGLPTITFAAPSAITEIEVEYTDNQIVVSWQAAPEANIASYRVYYSNQSILQNQGEYDDFKETDGLKTFMNFDEFTAGEKKYFSVLAVDDAGIESSGFIKEVSVTVPMNIDEAPIFQLPNRQNSTNELPLVATRSTSSSTSSQTPTTVELLSAQAINPETVQLNFSTYITVEDAAAQGAFTIKDKNGVNLHITKLVIDGLNVQLGTEKQVKNMIYEVQLQEPIMGFLQNEPLDATARRAFFTGHPNGKDASSVPISNTTTPTTPVQQNSSAAFVADTVQMPADVQNIRISATNASNNSYNVQVQWDVPMVSGDLAYYLVSQTDNGGKTFSQPQVVQAGVGGVQIPNVPKGTFGINVQIVNKAGFMSKGVYKSVVLAPTVVNNTVVSSSSSVPSTIPVQAQVTQNPVQGKGGSQLPQTGTTFAIGMVIVAGAIAGIKRSKHVAF